MQTEKEQIEGVSSYNGDYSNSSALQIRLETQRIIDQIEFFLRGLEPNVFFDDKTQSWQTKLKEAGMPKANKQGIQALLNFCRAIINPQTVQGNYTDERYIDFIIEKRIDLARACFVNFYEWELLADDNIEEITNFIMSIIEPFMSRTIDNKERESYAATIRTSETNTIPKQNKGMAGLFGGGQ
jgi:hypothetical protein